MATEYDIDELAPGEQEGVFDGNALFKKVIPDFQHDECTKNSSVDRLSQPLVSLKTFQSVSDQHLVAPFSRASTVSHIVQGNQSAAERSFQPSKQSKFGLYSGHALQK